MKRRRGVVLAVMAALALLWLLGGWFASGPLTKDSNFTVPEGASLATVADKLASAHAISSARAFRWRARLLGGGGGGLRAGEFLLPRGASPSRILAILKHGIPLRRFVTVPEGLPSIMVRERLLAQDELTGEVPVPEEGSILPDTYQLSTGESRAEVVAEMQKAMARELDRLWADRAPDIAVKTPEEAMILASIVEKETGKPEERAEVAGLYSNRLRKGMRLQADPTIIYPITRGKPLGRRILQSEINAVNDYNTYAMAGLPKAPITNPGKASIEAVLHPAQTDALYMVADGTCGHAFAATLAEHNANVAKWVKAGRPAARCGGPKQGVDQ